MGDGFIPSHQAVVGDPFGDSWNLEERNALRCHRYYQVHHGNLPFLEISYSNGESSILILNLPSESLVKQKSASHLGIIPLTTSTRSFFLKKLPPGGSSDLCGSGSNSLRSLRFIEIRHTFGPTFGFYVHPAMVLPPEKSKTRWCRNMPSSASTAWCWPPDFVGWRNDISTTFKWRQHSCPFCGGIFWRIYKQTGFKEHISTTLWQRFYSLPPFSVLFGVQDQAIGWSYFR